MNYIEILVPNVWYTNKFGEIFQVPKKQLTNGDIIYYCNRYYYGGITKSANATNKDWFRTALEATEEQIRKYIPEYNKTENYELY